MPLIIAFCAFANDCIRDLFLTVRQGVIEWIEHGDDLLEAIELGFAERLIGVKKIERAAACRRVNPFFGAARDLPRCRGSPGRLHPRAAPAPP